MCRHRTRLIRRCRPCWTRATTRARPDRDGRTMAECSVEGVRSWNDEAQPRREIGRRRAENSGRAGGDVSPQETGQRTAGQHKPSPALHGARPSRKPWGNAVLGVARGEAVSASHSDARRGSVRRGSRVHSSRTSLPPNRNDAPSEHRASGVRTSRSGRDVRNWSALRSARARNPRRRGLEWIFTDPVKMLGFRET